ncbi:hypothetical protein [Massilia violaceinigra]|nr:hypothetical protein [Massilia violaceinigra]
MDCTTAKDMPNVENRREPRAPEQGENISSMDIVGLGAALGAGFGAHVVRQAGPVAGGAAIGVFGAAVGGVAASGVTGWKIGSLIGDIPSVSKYLDHATGMILNAPSELGHLYVAPKYPDEFWKFHPGPGSTPSDVWWYVPELGDRIAGTGDTVFRDPYAAIGNAGIDYGGQDEGGGRKIALLAIAKA